MKKWLPLLLIMLIFMSCSPALAVVTVYHRGDTEKNQIAITVDDCYNIERMRLFLDLFAKEEIHVTFYPVGAAIKEENADLWQRILDEGHEIGNHTNDHSNLTKCDGKTIIFQLQHMEKKLNKALGYEYTIRTMRPPYGSFSNAKTRNYISAAGYKHLVMWSVNQQDPKKALKSIKNGSICLFHANRLDLECLTELIPMLKEKGFEMVTISDLLGIAQEEEGEEI